MGSTRGRRDRRLTMKLRLAIALFTVAAGVALIFKRKNL